MIFIISIIFLLHSSRIGFLGPPEKVGGVSGKWRYLKFGTVSFYDDRENLFFVEESVAFNVSTLLMLRCTDEDQ